MTKQRFTVTHEDGTKSTRTSQTKDYSHAVVITTESGTYAVLRWSQTWEAAAKARDGFHRSAHRYEDCRSWASARVVEVDAPAVEPPAAAGPRFFLLESASADTLF